MEVSSIASSGSEKELFSSDPERSAADLTTPTENRKSRTTPREGQTFGLERAKVRGAFVFSFFLSLLACHDLDSELPPMQHATARVGLLYRAASMMRFLT